MPKKAASQASGRFGAAIAAPRAMLFTGLFIPFAGTLLGAALVFLLRGDLPAGWQKLLLGFASGVMIAAAVWSLLLPSIALAEAHALPAWLPAAAGFLGGMAFLLLLDRLIPHRHLHAEASEGPRVRLGRTTKLLLAVTLHNIPEGMAVGVVVAGALLHDIGKLTEFVPGDGGQAVHSPNYELMRHPLSGAIIAAKAGLPDSIVHLIATHSFEGDRSYHTVESEFVRTVDIFVFNCSVKGLEKC